MKVKAHLSGAAVVTLALVLFAHPTLAQTSPAGASGHSSPKNSYIEKIAAPFSDATMPLVMITSASDPALMPGVLGDWSGNNAVVTDTFSGFEIFDSSGYGNVAIALNGSGWDGRQHTLPSIDTNKANGQTGIGFVPGGNQCLWLGQSPFFYSGSTPVINSGTFSLIYSGELAVTNTNTSLLQNWRNNIGGITGGWALWVDQYNSNTLDFFWTTGTGPAYYTIPYAVQAGRPFVFTASSSGTQMWFSLNGIVFPPQANGYSPVGSTTFAAGTKATTNILSTQYTEWGDMFRVTLSGSFMTESNAPVSGTTLIPYVLYELQALGLNAATPVVFAGDSLVNGYPLYVSGTATGNHNPWAPPAQTNSLLGLDYYVINTGSNGQTTQQMITSSTSGALDATWTGYNSEVLYVLQEGYNSMASGTAFPNLSASSTIIQTGSVCQSVRNAIGAKNPNCKVVILVDTIPSTGIGRTITNGTYDPAGTLAGKVDQYNSILASGSSGILVSGSLADDIVTDIASDPNLSGTAAPLNTLYYQSDQLHLTQAGYAIIAGYAKKHILLNK